MSRFRLVSIAVAQIAIFSSGSPSVASAQVIFSGYQRQNPGVVHKITTADLPNPNATKAVDNGAELISRPKDAWPKTLPGFKVTLFAEGLGNPRLIRTAPNGDIFVVESAPGKILVFRGFDTSGKAVHVQVFATGLTQPFGLRFYPGGSNPQWLYVGNTDSVVRFPYRNGDMKARGAAQKIADLPGGGKLRGGGHWTRDITFSKDNKKMYVSVGSHSNDDDSDNNPAEYHRADVLEFNPDGSGLKVYASGIRNCVGIETDPISGEIWCSTNERDDLGDNLVPDYITHLQPGGFYGWPWWYMGGNQDPRHKGVHPELKSKVITPDVLIQPHNASLEMTFYYGKQFPQEYHGDIFASEHGSWNRAPRTGYEVIRVPMQGDKTNGTYEDFLTGFVTADGKVWGRPVGVTVARDGSLLVTDDASNSIWRVSYVGK